MDRQKFLVLTAASSSALLLPNIGNASVYYDWYGRDIYLASGFRDSATDVMQNMIQSKTGWSLSCGPTCMLFALNHFYNYDSGRNAAFANSIFRVENMLESIYSDSNVFGSGGKNGITNRPMRHSTTHMNALRNYANNNWGWECQRNYHFQSSYKQGIKNCLLNNGLVMFSSNANATHIHNTRDLHLILCYAYVENLNDSGRSYYLTFEPYFGKFSYFYEKDKSKYLAFSGNALLIKRF